MKNEKYKEENRRILSLLKEHPNDKELLGRLLVNNDGFIHSICQKVAKWTHSNGVSDYDDLYQIAAIAMMDAVVEYNNGKDEKYEEFSSFAYSYILRKVEENIAELRGIAKIPYVTQKKVGKTPQIGQEIDTVDKTLSQPSRYNPEAVFLREEREVELYNVIKEVLSEKEQFIIVNHLGLFGLKKRTQKDIAKALNIAQSSISEREIRIRKKLYPALIRAGLYPTE